MHTFKRPVDRHPPKSDSTVHRNEEETLVADDRAALTPSQIVEQKLIDQLQDLSAIGQPDAAPAEARPPMSRLFARSTPFAPTGILLRDTTHLGGVVLRWRGHVRQKPPGISRFVTELRELLGTARLVWQILSRSHRSALLSAVAVMAVGGVLATVVPLLSGRLVDRVAIGLQTGEPQSAVLEAVAYLLCGIGVMVLMRELLQVIRRYLVENTCTRIERHTTVKVLAHLLQADLSGLTHEKIGVLHGRIFRSVDGFMRLLRLSFLDFFPAVIVGAFAIATAVWKEPRLGLVMLGVIPTSLALTVWQLISQKRVRLKLLRVNEEMDGTVVELLGGLDYVRVANAHAHELRRVRGQPNTAARRN